MTASLPTFLSTEFKIILVDPFGTSMDLSPIQPRIVLDFRPIFSPQSTAPARGHCMFRSVLQLELLKGMVFWLRSQDSQFTFSS